MRTAGFWLLLAALPACAQVAAGPVAAKPAPTFASIGQPRFSLDVIHQLEDSFDARLDSAGTERMHVMGGTRGLYLPGYGLVFTAELDLTFTPMPGGLVRREITPADRTTYHTKKLQQLAVLQRLMREMVTASVQKVDPMPENERIVLAVRLMYQSWEDQTDLPRQILMTADRKSALAGQIAEVSTK